MRRAKHLNLFFAFLLIFSTFGFLQPNVGNAAPLENAVTIMAIDDEGAAVFDLIAIEIEEGDTAIDVLETATEQEDVDLGVEEHPDFGTMITSIGEAEEHDDYFWSFIVNGLGAEVGASTYEVENGDNILFSLTKDFEPTLNVKVSAMSGDEAFLEDTEVMLMEYATGYDALYQASVQNEVALQSSIDSEFLTFINNVGDVELDETDYWNISVNDEELMAGILEYNVESDDHVQLELQSFDDSSEAENENSLINNGEDIAVVPNMTDKTAEETIQEIKDYIDTNNIELKYGSEWWLWGLANTDEEIPKSYLESVIEEVEDVDGEFKNSLDLERIIIALSLMDEKADSVNECDLIDLLGNHPQLEKPMINSATYALLAFDSWNYDVEESEKKRLIDFILDQELEQGGWSFDSDEPSADITGMVLAALSPYHDNEKVQEAINHAVDNLSIIQKENGGYDEEVNGGYTSEAVSQAIIGLLAVGVDPTSQEFTKNEINLLQHLLLYKNDDFGFSHTLEEGESNDISTSQALLAFTAYERYSEEPGSVYKNDTSSIKHQSEADNSASNQIVIYLVIALIVIIIGGIGLVMYNKNKQSKK